MKLKPLAASLALVLVCAHAAHAGHGRHHSAPQMFQHVATFDVTRNRVTVGTDEIVSEVAEIVDVTKNGRGLVYTDSASKLIGFVDITDPANPTEDGVVLLDGEPTSVAVHGRYALAGVNTSATAAVYCADDDEDIGFITDWSGKLVVIDIARRTIVAELPMGGQPDSVAVSPDGRYAAVVVENERNEDVSDGLIPQGSVTDTSDPCDLTASGAPVPGKLVVIDMRGRPRHWTTRDVNLAGLPGMFAADDPEPEFVDINRANMAVVSLQENNHVAIVNLRNARVVKHFPAGEVDLRNVDTEEEDLINLDSDITKRREPDAVAWIGNGLFATANEGDYEDASGEEGGSRGFTVFNTAGKVKFESYESFEHTLVSAGHYNEGRSENKGVEPESVEFGRYGRDDLVFVGSERSNAVGVYKMHGVTAELQQVLPEVVRDRDRGTAPDGTHAHVEAERLGVYYSDLIPVLVKAIQEQEARIDALQAELEAMRER